MTQEQRDRVSKSLLGNARKKGKITSEEQKKKLSVSMKGKNTFKRTDETRKNMSKSAKESYRHGREVSGGLCKWYTLSDGQKVQGTYEQLFGEFLIANGIAFKSHTGKLPYTLNNEQHTYLPDFYLIDIDLYVEIKSTYTLTMSDEKLCAILDGGHSVAILTEVELKETINV